jgi:hypothetical protein
LLLAGARLGRVGGVDLLTRHRGPHDSAAGRQGPRGPPRGGHHSGVEGRKRRPGSADGKPEAVTCGASTRCEMSSTARKSPARPCHCRARHTWWPGTESNRRHGDFQSPALPTELPGQIFAGRRLARPERARIRAVGAAFVKSGIACRAMNRLPERRGVAVLPAADGSGWSQALIAGERP